MQTGSQIGQNSEKSLVSRLIRLLADHQFLEVESVLKGSDENATEPDPARTLTSRQKQLLRGILANRQNRPKESIQLLEPLLESSSTPTPPNADSAEERLLQQSLAEDYLRSGDLAKAGKAYQAFAARFGSALSPDEKDEIELQLKLLPLAADNPPMTVEPGDAFALAYDRNPLGLTDIPVFVDAQSHDWMLDPTAPFNLICRSTAKSVGLKVSEEAATVTTITGHPIQVHSTLIPRFTIGTVTYRNMTAFVFEDADYYFPETKYQVRGVLGYPAVSALGKLTLTAGARIEVQPDSKTGLMETGAQFFLDGERIVTALGKPGNERIYVLDVGGQETYLTSRYFAEHSDEFAEKKMQLQPPPGQAAEEPPPPPVPTYTAESVSLWVGDTPLTLQFTPVLTEPIGNAAIDDTYGTLGMDALEDLKSYTFDYRTMRFSIHIQ